MHRDLKTKYFVRVALYIILFIFSAIGMFDAVLKDYIDQLVSNILVKKTLFS